MRSHMQHHLNALHVTAALVRCGSPGRHALSLAR